MTNTSNNNREHGVEEAIWQFLDAQLQGSVPDIEVLVNKYPEFEDRIRQKIREFQKVDSLFDILSQAGENEFENIVTQCDLIGQKVGNFEIVEMIGKGGMGVVYLAHDTRLKRSVAIKSIPAGLADDSTARMRFRREAELLASLNHPNIAVIHEIIEEDKSGYLILEYVPGETLSERIDRETLELGDVLSIGRQIAEAVSAAHKGGVVHRDLKPGNIKITPDGRVKVLDFGLAKPSVSEDGKSDITTTEAGRIIGTPAYMSPEQTRGKSTDHRTDIWSFGCIMYQMLTGRLPFEAETATDTLARIIGREPDWEALPKETPENVRFLLHHCLEKNPNQRLRNIEDVAIEIKETFSKSKTTQLKPKAVKSRIVAMIVSAAVIIVLSGLALKYIPKKEAKPPTKHIRLVVLPFENLGPADDEWFADGMTDEITSRLASIHGLGVISRQSAIQYKNKEKSIPQIAEELGVDYILEGTIQRERPSDPNSKVRIRSQLIRAADDTHVWSEIYDYVNNVTEVLRMQSEVAEQVAQGLDINLLEPERQALATRPTENMQAYAYYMRGNDYSSRPYQNKDNLMLAIKMYEEAIKLDPMYALAHARLSHAYSGMYWFRHDRTEECLAMAWKELNKALKINPDLPEAHWALGVYYYWGHSDYVRALEELEIARNSQPNNSRILASIGHVKKRQGKFEEALTNYKKAYELNPQSSPRAGGLGSAFLRLGRYQEAEHYYQLCTSLSPSEDNDLAYRRLANLYLVWKGKTDDARKVLKSALPYIDLTKSPGIVNLQIWLDVLDRNYQQALDRLSRKSQTGNALSYSDALRYAQIYEFMGDKKSAKEYYEEALEILKSKILEDPNNALLHSSLGIAYAGLDREKDAIREGELGVELLPESKDTILGLRHIETLAYIYILIGRHEQAIDKLEYLLQKSLARMSIPMLELDPAWDPLRKHPRFIELLETGK